MALPYHTDPFAAKRKDVKEFREGPLSRIAAWMDLTFPGGDRPLDTVEDRHPGAVLRGGYKPL